MLTKDFRTLSELPEASTVTAESIPFDRHRVALQKKFEAMLIRAQALLPSNHRLIELLAAEAKNPTPSTITFAPGRQPVFGWRRT